MNEHEGTKMPYESLNWFDIYIQYPGIEGEFKMTITDKGVDSTEAMNKSIMTLEHLIALKQAKPGLEIRATGVVMKKKEEQTDVSQTVPSQSTPPAQATQHTAVNGGFFEIDQITIVPRPDGRVDAGFHMAGHQYPDVKVTRDPSQIATMLNNTFGTGFTEDDMRKGQTIGNDKVSGTLYWENSTKMNSKGNPYKNLVRIEVI
jgi:hypothetical protein